MKLPIILSQKCLHQAHQVSELCLQLFPIRNKKRPQVSKIKTITSFLSMEEEDLSDKQVAKILENKPTRTLSEQVQEVKNLNRIYVHLLKWDPLSIKDFKQCHKMLLTDISHEKSGWRIEEVVVYEGKKIAHIPPNAREVTTLMKELFHFIKTRKDLSWLIKACVFHYGIQYIHPFLDGNGRMGRIWQHLLLLKESPLFRYILIGDIIKNDPIAYYKSLDKSDKLKNGEIFIKLCLRKITYELKNKW